MTKTCAKCEVEKPLDAFSPDKREKDGLQSQCKKCRTARECHRYATDPEFAQRKRDATNARYHGGELPDSIDSPRPAGERFDEKWILDPETGCHLWTANQHKSGYGKVKVNGETFLAHRFAYWQRWGVIPKPELHHKCRNRLCVNPDHLQAVTKEEHEEIHRREARDGSRSGG